MVAVAQGLIGDCFPMLSTSPNDEPLSIGEMELETGVANQENK